MTSTRIFSVQCTGTCLGEPVLTGVDNLCGHLIHVAGHNTSSVRSQRTRHRRKYAAARRTYGTCDSPSACARTRLVDDRWADGPLHALTSLGKLTHEKAHRQWTPALRDLHRTKHQPVCHTSLAPHPFLALHKQMRLQLMVQGKTI